MEDFKKVFEGLSEDQQKEISLIMIKKYLHLDGGNGDSCTGCTPTTPYGGCYKIDGDCIWIPEFGS